MRRLFNLYWLEFLCRNEVIHNFISYPPGPETKEILKIDIVSNLS